MKYKFIACLSLFLLISCAYNRTSTPIIEQAEATQTLIAQNTEEQNRIEIAQKVSTSVVTIQRIKWGSWGSL